MGKSLGNYLRRLREDRNLTLRDIEERTGISNPYLSQIERGERGVPNFSILNRLAEVYGVPLVELVNAAELEAEGSSIDFDVLPPNAKKMAEAYVSLPKDDQKVVWEFVQFLYQKHKKKKKTRLVIRTDKKKSG